MTTTMTAAASAPDGRAMRAYWDRLCAGTIEVLQAARRDASDDAVVSAYLEKVIAAVRALHATAAGKRLTPVDAAPGLVHDEPQQLRADDRYAAAVAAIDGLAQHWRDKLGAPDWDWAGRGYPPGWTSSVGDRLRAGLFYRSR
ncbi:MAG: hypothetical protein JO222_07005 [Frankiales bacterium]|nr:hypothetical protein [Frankiales bacterium]